MEVNKYTVYIYTVNTNNKLEFSKFRQFETSILANKYINEVISLDNKGKYKKLDYYKDYPYADNTKKILYQNNDKKNLYVMFFDKKSITWGELGCIPDVIYMNYKNWKNLKENKKKKFKEFMIEYTNQLIKIDNKLQNVDGNIEENLLSNIEQDLERMYISKENKRNEVKNVNQLIMDGNLNYIEWNLNYYIQLSNGKNKNKAELKLTDEKLSLINAKLAKLKLYI